ncbi:V-type ATPase subunit [[Clostridium] leptum]|uniref:ATP synthase subunit C n=1 Tax=Solibaculum mannosilyticum TaxID=2780922 RepID=A0A7I8CYF1_9FIRM|nr:V-type ATPase subunit [Solibaculum mannosilyticum]MCO7137145.1 V-type ATPase subunit [[Clostridium] leptum]BCI59498.1 ATP synthase subunit C [Solibaculum mannosilyticum]
MAIKDTNYVYAVANIRVKEMGLLTRSDVDAMLAAPTLEDAVRLLEDKGWQGADRLEPWQFETILTNELQDAWEYVRGLSPQPEVFDLLLYPNDFHNLKACIKGAYANVPVDGLFLQPSVLDPEEMNRCIQKGERDKLPDLVREPAQRAYEILSHTGDGQLCDVLLDRACLDAIQKAADGSKSKWMTELGHIMVDTANIKTSVRACRTGKGLDFLQQAIAPCSGFDREELIKSALQGEQALREFLSHTSYAQGIELLADSLSPFEKWCDDLVLKQMLPTKLTAFGEGPLAAYLMAKQAEIKTVRIVLLGKQGGVPQDVIRERVRELYG